MSNDAIEVKLQSLANWALAGLVIIIVFVVCGTSFMLWQAYKIGQQGVQLQSVALETHTALCALKRDIQVRRQTAAEFLRENPAGIPGIPRAQIETAITNYDGTLDALRVLVCD